MLSFRKFLKESYLIENRDWHQFVNQNSKSLLDRAGLTVPYMNLQGERGHGTPEHLTDYLSDQLGIKDLSSEEGRWVLKHFNTGGIKRTEDIESVVIPNLQRLRKAKEEGKSTAKLANLKGPLELSGHLSKIYPVSQESLSDLDPTEYTIHGENEHWTVVQPRTKNAACTVGKGTEWCTASRSNSKFNDYNDEGPLVAFIPKKPAYKGERYQAWLPKSGDEDSGQFMDHTDNEIGEKNPMPDFTERPLPQMPHLDSGSSVHKTINFAKNQPRVKQISADLKGGNEDEAKRALNDDLFGSHQHHMRHALESPHESVARAALEHPLFGKGWDDISDALYSPHEFVARAVLEHPNFKFEHSYDISHALHSPHEIVARAAVEHPLFKAGKFNKLSALKSPHEFVARAAVEHPNFKFEESYDISYALKSPHEFVARAAVEHPLFGSVDTYHFGDALKSPHESVARAAVEHPRFGKGMFDLNDALNSPHEFVARAAVEHPSFGKGYDDINDALKSPHESVARAVLEHPRFGKGMFDRNNALKSPHESVRRAASKLINQNKTASLIGFFSKHLQNF